MARERVPFMGSLEASPVKSIPRQNLSGHGPAPLPLSVHSSVRLGGAGSIRGSLRDILTRPPASLPPFRSAISFFTGCHSLGLPKGDESISASPAVRADGCDEVIMIRRPFLRPLLHSLPRVGRSGATRCQMPLQQRVAGRFESRGMETDDPRTRNSRKAFPETS